MTLDDFIASRRVTMTVARTDDNPNMDADEKWAREASHWRCYLKANGRHMSIAYSMGSAHTGEPQLRDVLDCLASDSTALDTDFPEWCAELGYEEDSRRAHRTWEICRRQAKALRRILGEADFATLLHDIERL